MSNVKCCKIEEFPSRSADDTSNLVDASEDDVIDIDYITSYDFAISRCCRYILIVPAAKAFKMLLPVLKAWLSNSHERSTANLVKARAVFATLSVLLHAQKLDVSDIIDNTVDSVYDSCMAVISIDSDSLSTTFCTEIQSRVLAPIAILFCYSSQMLIKFLENCKNKVLSTNIHTEEKRKIIQTLEYLLRNKTLSKVISTDASDTIRNTIEAIDAFTLGGPLDSCGGKLLILANQIIGNSYRGLAGQKE
jgi:hypothetical protein